MRFEFTLTEDFSDRLFFEATGGIGDLDITIYDGPFISDFVCRSIELGEVEVCGFEGLPAGTYTVLLTGDFSDVTLLATPNQPALPDLKLLGNNAPELELSAISGDRLYYSIDLTKENAALSITLSGGTGDADLIVFQSDFPFDDKLICRELSPGNDEECTFDSLPAGTYTVVVESFFDFEGVTLLATYDEPPAICEFEVVHQSKRRFNADIFITNDSDTPIEGWEISWEHLDGARVTRMSDAVLSGNNPYTATNRSDNGTILPGETIAICVQGRKKRGTLAIPIITSEICRQ